MKTISRYIMTLALLITAVGGAWADETYPIVYDFEAVVNASGTLDNKNGSAANGQQFYGWESESYKDRARQDYKGYEWRDGTSSNLPEVCHVWRRGDRININISNGGLQCPGDKLMAVDGLTEGLTVTIIYDATNATDKEILWAIGDGSSSQLTQPRATATINGVEAVPGQTTIKSGDVITVNSVTAAQDGSGYIVFKVMKDMVIKKIIIDEAKAASAIEVTTNAAEEGATFTEASFEMPTSDVDVDYELVRDMGYKVAFSGVPTRARLAKDGDGKFHFADPLTFQLLDNIDAANPKDITSAEGITFMVGEVEAVDFEGNTFYQLNKETLVPLADFLADAHLGNYAICAVASTGEYDGSFTSGKITLFQGYEVQVAAKEFITYYKDEPLYVEDEAAELYTISSVNGDQAVLSDRSDAMPSNTPMLVYNKSNETKVILLIPCAEPDMAITVAPEFQGTLNGTTIAASTENETNYAFNGKQFVFVKNAIEVGPNKAWISIPSDISNVKALTIVFGDATGLKAIENGELKMENWYDLNGRKLNGMPIKKGIYVKNGRKVVVK